MNNTIPVCDCDNIHSDIVTLVKQGMLPAAEIKGLSILFKILGDPTRIRIMSALSQSEMCVCDLAESLGMTKSAISHQLSTLKQVNLVKYRREGKNVFYSIDDEHVDSIIAIGRMHIQHK